MMVVAAGAVMVASASESRADHRHYSNRGGYSISFNYGSGYGNGMSFGYSRGGFGNPYGGGFGGGYPGYGRSRVQYVPVYPSYGYGGYGGGYGGGRGGWGRPHGHCR